MILFVLLLLDPPSPKLFLQRTVVGLGLIGTCAKG
jgi:hypothetical protein